MFLVVVNGSTVDRFENWVQNFKVNFDNEQHKNNVFQKKLSKTNI
jgi:hypothetical protein